MNAGHYPENHVEEIEAEIQENNAVMDEDI